MSEAVSIRTDLSQSDWDEYVEGHDQASFYQLYAWRAVLESTFGHRSHYLSAHRGEKTVGVFPITEVKSRLFGHSLISTAFCVGGGPLSSDKAAQQGLVKTAIDLAGERGVGYLEVRDAEGLEHLLIGRSGLHSSFEREIAADEDACLKQIPRKQRAVVRKALAGSLRTSIEGDVKSFYNLHALTFRNHGTPVFPRRYYEALLSEFPGKCDVLTVWDDGTPISSVMNFYIRSRVTPYYTGSLGDARRLGANDFMYFKLMRSAADRGYTSFDFGRSKIGSGPHAFKKNWGFEPRPVTNWFHLETEKDLPNIGPTNPKFALAIQVWQRMPVPIANFISRFVSPNLA